MIDFIIPTFNRSWEVARAASSCLYFCYRYGGKIIIADNNSSSIVYNELQCFASCRPCIKLVKSPDYCAGKPPLNWLFGLQQSTAEFVHLLFSDDILLPSFEQCYTTIELLSKAQTREHKQSLILHSPDFINEYGAIFSSKYYIGFSNSNNKKISHYFIKLLLQNNLYVPRSPCAYTMPRHLATESLDRSIATFSENYPNAINTGAGVDTLMILNVLDANIDVSFLIRKSVLFATHSESITIKYGKDLSVFYDFASSYKRCRPRGLNTLLPLYFYSFLKLCDRFTMLVKRIVKKVLPLP